MSLSFFDSNVILYLLSADTAKADRSESLLGQGGVISVQVLNEVVSVCRRKLKMPWEEIDALLAALKSACAVVPLTVESHDYAVILAKTHQLSFYDAHICAAALLAGADELLSEDMHPGLQLGEAPQRMVIRNPFLSPGC